jgi:ADP-ribosylglycohydrolase
MNYSIHPYTPLLTYIQRKNERLIKKTVMQLPKNSKGEKILGSMLGLAIGDILGCPVEGMSFQDIQARYGRVDSLICPAYWKHWRLPGLHSDDTQQALAIFEAIKKVAPKGIEDLDETTVWQITNKLAVIYVQGMQSCPNASFGCWRGTGRGYRSVVEQLSQNAPISTGKVTSGMKFLIKNVMGQLRNEQAHSWPLAYGAPSAGLGAVMRIAPVGVLCQDIDTITRLVPSLTFITHKDPLAIVSACTIAFASHLLGQENTGSLNPDNFLSRLHKIVQNFEKNLPWPQGVDIEQNTVKKYETLNSSLISVVKEISKASPKRAIREIAKQTYTLTGKKGHPTAGFSPPGVAASLYFFVHDIQNPKDALLTSINAGGDTDTIGAIVGGLCGAYHGSEAYQEFLPHLVGLDFIIEKTYAVIDHKALDTNDLIEEESFLTEIEENMKTILQH